MAMAAWIGERGTKHLWIHSLSVVLIACQLLARETVARLVAGHGADLGRTRAAATTEPAPKKGKEEKP